MRQNVTSIDVDKKSEIRASHNSKTLVIDHGVLAGGINISNYTFITIYDMMALRKLEVALEKIKKELMK